jgi:hypothetical protein
VKDVYEEPGIFPVPFSTTYQARHFFPFSTIENTQLDPSDYSHIDRLPLQVGIGCRSPCSWFFFIVAHVGIHVTSYGGEGIPVVFCIAVIV